MKRALALLAAMAALCSFSLAQDGPGFQEHFDRGIAALTAGRYDEGIAAFESCLELDPENSTCAYNIACGYSLKKELDPAFEWLDRAADWGFGMSESSLELAQTKDEDLANLRSDPRFAPIVEKMKRLAAQAKSAAEKEWKTPIVILPEGHEEMESVGALVVLHDAGETKQSVAESFWKEIAAQHRLALVVPSGKLVAGRAPEDGMQWFDDFDAFSARYWTAEEPLEAALAALKAALKNVEIDRKRSVLVGLGQGALVAFNATMRAPRNYAGVLAVDGPILPNLTQSYLQNAVGAGVRIRAVLDSDATFGIPKAELQRFVGQVRTALEGLRFDATITTYAADAAQPNARRDLIEQALSELLPAPRAPDEPKSEPVEAGTGGE